MLLISECRDVGCFITSFIVNTYKQASPKLANEVPQLSGLSQKKINKKSDCLKLVDEITPRRSPRFTVNGKIEKSSIKVRSKFVFFG